MSNMFQKTLRSPHVRCSNPSDEIAYAAPCMSSHMFKSIYIGLQLCEGGKPWKELVLVVTTEVQTIEMESYRK